MQELLIHPSNILLVSIWFRMVLTKILTLGYAKMLPL